MLLTAQVYELLEHLQARVPSIILRHDSVPQGPQCEIDLVVPDAQAHVLARLFVQEATSDLTPLLLRYHPLHSEVLVHERLGGHGTAVLLDIRGPVIKSGRRFCSYSDLDAATVIQDRVRIVEPEMDARLLVARNRIDRKSPEPKHIRILKKGFPEMSDWELREELVVAERGLPSRRIDDPDFLRSRDAVGDRLLRQFTVWRWRFRRVLLHKPVLNLISLHGPDGAGKSTAARAISEKLSSCGVDAPWFHYLVPQDRPHDDLDEPRASPRSPSHGDGRVGHDSRNRLAAHVALLVFLVRTIPTRVIRGSRTVQIHDRHLFDYLDVTTRRGQSWPRITCRTLARIQTRLTIPFVLHASTDTILRRTTENDAATIKSLVMQQSYLLVEDKVRASRRGVGTNQRNPHLISRLIDATQDVDAVVRDILNAWSLEQRKRLDG